jgi:hypothetical protein
MRMRPGLLAIGALCLSLLPTSASAAATTPAWTVPYFNPAGFTERVVAHPVAGDPETTLVGYRSDGNTLRALDQDGNPIWPTKTFTDTHINVTSGFDFNADQWPDVMLVRLVQSITGTNCTGMWKRSVRIWDGATGNEVNVPVQQALDDACVNGCPPSLCWTRLARWSGFQPLFGPGKELVFQPYYSDYGWFMRYNDSTGQFEASLFFQPYAAYLPPAPGYNSTYPSPPRGQASSSPLRSPLMNGLITKVGGLDRLVTFTGGLDTNNPAPASQGPRASQFRLDLPMGTTPVPGQLVAENTRDFGCQVWGAPPHNGTCTQADGYYLGRVYGQTIDDPGSDRVALITGADAKSVYDDLRANRYPPSTPDGDPLNTANRSDEYGGNERRIAVYNASTNTASNRYYSGAHNASFARGQRYFGRVLYPANSIVEQGPQSPSRYAYNVYSDLYTTPFTSMQWVLHVTQPGVANDEKIYRDRFLWDIRDIDQDGIDEWITSPVTTSGPAGHRYLPDKRLEIFTWNESIEDLVLERTLNDCYPYLQAHDRLPTVSSAKESMWPVLSEMTANGPKMLVWCKNPQGGADIGPQPEP